MCDYDVCGIYICIKKTFQNIKNIVQNTVNKYDTSIYGYKVIV